MHLVSLIFEDEYGSEIQIPLRVYQHRSDAQTASVELVMMFQQLIRREYEESMKQYPWSARQANRQKLYRELFSLFDIHYLPDFESFQRVDVIIPIQVVYDE